MGMKMKEMSMKTVFLKEKGTRKRRSRSSGAVLRCERMHQMKVDVLSWL